MRRIGHERGVGASTVRGVGTDDFRGWSGLQVQVNDDSYYTSRNNRWDHKTYLIPAELTKPFKWDGRASSTNGTKPATT